MNSWLMNWSSISCSYVMRPRPVFLDHSDKEHVVSTVKVRSGAGVVQACQPPPAQHRSCLPSSAILVFCSLVNTGNKWENQKTLHTRSCGLVSWRWWWYASWSWSWLVRWSLNVSPHVARGCAGDRANVWLTWKLLRSKQTNVRSTA